jgi:hypothetical protein
VLVPSIRIIWGEMKSIPVVDVDETDVVEELEDVDVT